MNSLQTTTIFWPYRRTANLNKPSLQCGGENGELRDTRDLFTVSETIGNGDLKYPVGLLTQDEAYLAGGRVSVMNQKYYLRTGSYYWLLSPYYLASSNGFSRSWFVYSTGNLDANPSTAAYGTRPVINIRGDVVIDSGTGTVSSPFAISL